MHIGLDFGTTNSAIAAAGENTNARLLPLSVQNKPLSVFRSILYFDADERDPTGRPQYSAGPEAIDAYLDHGTDGRLIQSIKSYLANKNFSSTDIFGSKFTLENLISLLIAAMIDAAQNAEQLRESFKTVPVTVGRPARFVRASASEPAEDPEELALGRLRTALQAAGIFNVNFELEPVAAAYAYEERIDRDETVLIGDFGGGTSDFCLLKVGPGARTASSRADTIMATGGVGVAGDAFDARIVEHCIAPELGRHLSYRSAGGKQLPMPGWIYDSLKQWHQLSFINTYKTRRLLAEIGATADEPTRIEALATLISGNRGFDIYRAVEAAKVGLSNQNEVTLRLAAPPIKIERTVKRADFESWIKPELTKVTNCLDDLMNDAGKVTVDRVFLTGGSSFLPAVRRLFERRFGADQISGGNELTSVATGLALAARNRARA